MLEGSGPSGIRSGWDQSAKRKHGTSMFWAYSTNQRVPPATAGGKLCPYIGMEIFLWPVAAISIVSARARWRN